MNWKTKIFILIILWTIWVLLVPFPIKIVKVEYVSIISSIALLVFGFILYTNNHDYPLLQKITSLLIVLPFIFFIIATISFGFVFENYGEIDLIIWDNNKRLIANSVLALISIFITVIMMEFVGYRFGNKTKK